MHIDGIFCLKEAKKVAFGTECFVISIFRRGIIAHHATQRNNAEKGVWLTIFALAKRKFISCSGCLIWKLGIYGKDKGGGGGGLEPAKPYTYFFVITSYILEQLLIAKYLWEC